LPRPQITFIGADATRTAILPAVEPQRIRSRDVPGGADVVVIGGGIIGCASAAILADRGARVLLIEGSAIGAGASGRNLGAIQHPFDPVLAPLYHESLSRYRALVASLDAGFVVPTDPAGLLLLNADGDAAARQAARMRKELPELDPRLLEPDDVADVEPSLAAGLSAVRLATGFPIPPAAATDAWARLAVDRGVAIHLGEAARPVVQDGRITGVDLDGGDHVAADRVLVAAGPWSPRLVDPTGAWQPIRPTYGVTLQLRLGDAAPHHVVEEDEVDAINRAAAATARAADAADAADGTDTAEIPSIFSLASAGGISTLGSTFLPAEPDAALVEPLLLRRAAAYLPAVSEAELVGRRMCARPQSVDGRPFIGPVGPDGLYVCAGHGPWGISTGPASAAIAARAILDGSDPPPQLAARRTIG
jgi:glycine/D-amino acid oxidase-like deaminating enzyme